MKPLLIFTILFILFSACNHNDLIKNTSTSTDTLIIKSKCAVYYSPDSIFTEKLKIELGETEYKQAADDYRHFIDKATNYLKLAHIKIIDAKGKKILKLLFKDKSQQLIELESLADPWGIIFFDEKRNPKPIDISLIEWEYTNYF